MNLEETVLVKSRIYRDYSSPREYYLRHKELHKLSRGELSLMDSGLYRSLVRWRQINVIPASKKFVALGSKGGKIKYSRYKIEKIVSSYDRFDGVALKVADFFSCSKGTVSRYWKRAGLKAVGRRLLSSKQIKEVIGAYRTYEGNATEASKHINSSTPTFLKYWKKAGLKTRKRGRPRTIF